LDADDKLQDAMLTVDHLCEQTLSQTAVVKLIENQNAVTIAQAMTIQQVPSAPQASDRMSPAKR
jgi:hypothetical protein